MLCPLLISAISRSVLRMCYAMFGTDIGYAATRSHPQTSICTAQSVRSAISCTGIDIVLCMRYALPTYAMSVAFAMRCP
eukprot:2571710-Rhodomonas_salina.2